jgi:hypothetical protein
MHTITQDQAQQGVQHYLHEAPAVMPPEARSELFVSDVGECLDPSDNGPPGRVEPSTTLQLRGLQPADYGELYLTSTSPCVWPNGTPPPPSVEGG